MIKPSYFAKIGLSVCAVSVWAAAFAQDSNVLHPIDQIEHLLKKEHFEIFRIRDLRFTGDITKRAILKFPGNQMIQVKWKRSAEGGWTTNNEPRYEIAAYKLQKLFLDPLEYVVPPTAARALPLSQYQKIEDQVTPTFKNTQDVVYVLQYWLEKVSMDDIYDKKRFDSDSTYAKHLGNMNILSYLIEHKDSNRGNFLISTDPNNPRVFAVDNGFSFESPHSNRGEDWRKIRLKRLPKKAIDRLRTVTRDTLDQVLAVVAQFELQSGFLRAVEPTAKINKKRGVHHEGSVIQFGLTEFEIAGLERRLKRLLDRVDSGNIKTF
ncbi:hypothetical protein MJD09_18720 [bacterium]|nr:hypothetical protein [bacterium]